jgi:hypothetical protein
VAKTSHTLTPAQLDDHRAAWAGVARQHGSAARQSHSAAFARVPNIRGMDEPHARTLVMAVDVLHNLLADLCGANRREGSTSVLKKANAAGFVTDFDSLRSIVERRHDVGHPSRVTPPGDVPPVMRRGDIWRDLQVIEDQFLWNGVIAEGHAFAKGTPLKPR